nr:MAG TPA: replisome organizer protein [Caudoviricetes sp.]
MGIERQFKGVWIPKDIWVNDNLNLQEKCFLTEINSLDDEERGCFALNEHFAKFFNLSKNRCSEVIKSLQDKGYIDVNYKYEGRKIVERTIRVKNKFFTPSEFRLPPSENRLTPSISRQTPSENLVDRITIENNNRVYIDEHSFMPPKLEEVDAYCRERNNYVDAKRFFDYYSAGNWKDKDGKPVKNWKQKMIANWERNATKPIEKKRNVDKGGLF